MPKTPGSFNSWPKDKLIEVSRQGGLKSKGRVLTEEHKRKIKEAWAKRLKKEG